MTSRASWFSPGLYKSTVKRYIWSALVHLILLILAVILPIISIPKEVLLDASKTENLVILNNIALNFPVFFSIVMSTVTAILVYRFLHSKRQAVFTHSLPVTRTQIFTSSFAAGMTLLAAPSIIVGVVLIVISVCGYNALFTVGGCLLWILANIFAAFVMFAVSTLAANLTGNSFALVGLNIVLHMIVSFVSGSFRTFASLFIYGYSNSGEITAIIERFNFLSCVRRLGLQREYIMSGDIMPYDWVAPIVVGLLAIVVVIVSWRLYKTRNTEVAGNLASHKSLNPIYKYLLTYFVSSWILGVLGSFIAITSAPLVITLLLISSIVYFGMEMLIRMSPRVLRSLKGYVVFLLCFTALTCFFAFVPFEYETYVPEREDIASVSLNQPYLFDFLETDNDSYYDDPEVIDCVLSMHKSFISPEMRQSVRTAYMDDSPNIHITYKHKDGRITARMYSVSWNEWYKYSDKLEKLDVYV